MLSQESTGEVVTAPPIALTLYDHNTVASIPSSSVRRRRTIANARAAGSRAAVQIVERDEVRLRRAPRGIHGIHDVVIRAIRRGCDIEGELSRVHVRGSSGSGTETNAPVTIEASRIPVVSRPPPTRSVRTVSQPTERRARVAPCDRHPVRATVEGIQHVLCRPVGEDGIAPAMKSVLMAGQGSSSGEQTNETRRGENQHTARKKGFPHAHASVLCRLYRSFQFHGHLGRGRRALVAQLRSILLQPPREKV